MAVFDKGSCRGITEPIVLPVIKTRLVPCPLSIPPIGLAWVLDQIAFSVSERAATWTPLLHGFPAAERATDCAFHRYRDNLPRSARQPFLRPRVRPNLTAGRW